MNKTVPLREVAHSRSGEKGNSSMVSVIAYDAKDYDILRDQITVEAVRKVYGSIARGPIHRYEVPSIGALNFVMEEVLEGGRSRTLAFEESGKALSSLMLTLPVEVPSGYVGRRDRDQSHPIETLAQPSGRSIRLGSATAWSRDRFSAARDLVDRGDLDYICFESMSEVTMSAAQVAKQDTGRGGAAAMAYDPYLVDRLGPILKDCKEKGIRIISNQGWLDPVGAARRIKALADSLGLPGLKVAAVTGADLTDRIADMGLKFLETGKPVADAGASIVSAEVYLGCEGIVQALRDGADVVLTTRVADACLYLGPLAFEFGWPLGNHEKMARGMVIGHLMECSAQLTGGYFADPGYKDVPGLENLGSPIAEVWDDHIRLSKVPGSGGLLTPATCKEQLLYEVGDPARYLAPDCVTNLGAVTFTQTARDEVAVHIGQLAGQKRPDTLKALVGIREGYMTEEMVIFAGPSSLQRAKMTQDLLSKRFEAVNLKAQELRFDYLGLNGVHREATPPPGQDPYEVILRVALKTQDPHEAEKLRKEIDPLAVNGVAGTGKWATSAPGSRVRSVIGLSSCLVPRDCIETQVSIL
ncbi:acyclic terpene utilization AtuA family protein [Achromobacter aloeverae]|nr:acyclic terpene utilization AtuA family protein [Achromobacter aloeverae]